MSKVDWSLAPIWAKSYGLIGVSRMPVWFDDHRYQYLRDGRQHEFDDGCTFSFSALSETEDRPKQPQAWSGDGLPPVGVLIEMKHKRATSSWARPDFYPETLLWVGDRHFVTSDERFGDISDYLFRPLKAAEQLAAESRESAIRELMDIAQVDCRVTAARLVDAGFKR